MIVYVRVKTLAFLIVLVLAELSWTQIIIPFGFWNNTSATLVISDATTYNYGSINISTPTDKTFSVSNTGNGAAFSMNAAAFTNPTVYTFKGGTYPGTGGTCIASLQISSSCTIVVTANRATTGTVTDTIQINYRRRTADVSATRPITATFTNVATQLAWITTPSFIKINECQSVTVQRQDSAGNLSSQGTCAFWSLRRHYSVRRFDQSTKVVLSDLFKIFSLLVTDRFKKIFRPYKIEFERKRLPAAIDWDFKDCDQCILR